MTERDVLAAATQNRLLAKISPEELRALAPHLELVPADYALPLIKPREPIHHIYFPVTCLASLVTVLEDGSTVESGSVGREGMVGISVILGMDTTPMQTLIQIPGEMIRVKAGVIKEAFGRGKTIHQMLIRYVHALFVVASQSAACNGHHQIAERCARWILMSSDGIGSDEVALTHEFLAAMLGVRRPGVTEAAVKLQEQGLINYRRGSIRIVDRAGLEDAACECYHAVKDEFDRLFDKSF